MSCGRSGLWPFGLWPFRFVAVPICGNFSLQPIRFVAFSVCGRFDLLPTNLCDLCAHISVYCQS